VTLATSARRTEPPIAGGWDRTQRVVIVSASVGAGHDGAAAELARRLRERGLRVDRYDFVDLLPGRLGRALRWFYQAELKVAPRSWDWLSHAFGHGRSPARVAATMTRLAGERLAALVDGDGTAETVAVVSTFPAASQVLGRLRRARRIRVPVTTFLTDASVHPLWVADGVDAHLAIHEVAAAQARALGATGVAVTGPAVGPGFRPARDDAERAHARVAFGLPDGVPLALVVAGSWGVGDVAGAARDIAATGLACPVVVCGRNTWLRRRLRRRAGIIALGWVADMPTLVRACSLVVQNAGGLTSLEALTSGVPVLTYRCVPGHGRTNAAALEQAGWAPWVHRRDDLPAALAAVAARTVDALRASESLRATDPTRGILAVPAVGRASRR